MTHSQQTGAYVLVECRRCGYMHPVRRTHAGRVKYCPQCKPFAAKEAAVRNRAMREVKAAAEAALAPKAEAKTPTPCYYRPDDDEIKAMRTRQERNRRLEERDREIERTCPPVRVKVEERGNWIVETRGQPCCAPRLQGYERVMPI